MEKIRDKDARRRFREYVYGEDGKIFRRMPVK
jgi:hypothetical protein